MGFIRDNFNQIYLEIIKSLYHSPEYTSKNKEGESISEFIDCSFTLVYPKYCFATCRNMSFDYLKGELDFYLSGSPYLKDILKYSKFWEKVTDDNRTINSNYGKLLLFDRNYHNYTQFEYAKDMLLRNIESKKAVMTIYNKENAHKSNDNPCTMYLQFIIRANKLNLYVKMRSSDVWYGLPYDVPFFVLMQFKMLKELMLKDAEKFKGVTIGSYNHQAGSLHMYHRNKESVKKIIENKDNYRVIPEKLFNTYIKDLI